MAKRVKLRSNDGDVRLGPPGVRALFAEKGRSVAEFGDGNQKASVGPPTAAADKISSVRDTASGWTNGKAE